MLSTQTVYKLAKTLTPEVIDYIHSDECYAQFMVEIITRFLDEKMGRMDDELNVELACCIMDSIMLRKV